MMQIPLLPSAKKNVRGTLFYFPYGQRNICWSTRCNCTKTKNIFTVIKKLCVELFYKMKHWDWEQTPQEQMDYHKSSYAHGLSADHWPMARFDTRQRLAIKQLDISQTHAISQLSNGWMVRFPLVDLVNSSSILFIYLFTPPVHKSQLMTKVKTKLFLYQLI